MSWVRSPLAAPKRALLLTFLIMPAHPHTVYAGTSGWSYASWKPGFYPAKLASAKFLQHYAGRLNTVEVNYTFRHFAPEKTLNNWIAATPPHFKFSLKAHQNITHVKRLRDASE